MIRVSRSERHLRQSLQLAYDRSLAGDPCQDRRSMTGRLVGAECRLLQSLRRLA